MRGIDRGDVERLVPQPGKSRIACVSHDKELAIESKLLKRIQ